VFDVSVVSPEWMLIALLSPLTVTPSAGCVNVTTIGAAIAP
jgi:hypothetical protein